jgi:hypothetical protein
MQRGHGDEPGLALPTWLTVLALGKAAGAFDALADNQAVIANHGGPVGGPVRVLTLHGTVKADELLNRCIVRVAGPWRQAADALCRLTNI